MNDNPPLWDASRKLQAIAYKYYMQQAWAADRGRPGVPAVGDYYCITREGLALYQITKLEAGHVHFTPVYWDDGQVAPADSTASCFSLEDFVGGGFAPHRCYCPPWCFARPVDWVLKA